MGESRGDKVRIWTNVPLQWGPRKSEQYVPATQVCPVVESHAILEELTADFPWYHQLHGFWQTIPSHNPHPATSHPGHDIGTSATILVGHQSAVPEGAVYPLHSSVPPIGTP
jgi:hypothetical protein